MVGLSITLGCPIRPDVFERYIPAQRGGFREIMEALIRFRSGEAMHDAVAISTLLDDRLMTWQTGEITVELAVAIYDKTSYSFSQMGQIVFFSI